MRAPRVRLADLRLEKDGDGLSYRAWVLCGGEKFAVHGKVAGPTELGRELQCHMDSVFETVFKTSYPDKALKS
jgi:hypothetical protein